MKYAKTLGLGLLVAALATTGCSENAGTPNKDSTPQAKTKKDVSNQAEHAPHGMGPNGGVVFDLGKYHAEFTVDHPAKECTVLFVTGDDTDAKPLPVAAEEFTLSIKETKVKEGADKGKFVPPMTITLKPVDAKDGKASKFVGTDPGIGNVADFDGTVLGVIDGKPSQGEFSESHGAAGHSHGHSHGADDALVWEGEPREHAGLEIKLGHHGKQLHAGEEVEPAVSITRGSQPVSDAKVFNSLLSADGATVLAGEVPTVFEPTTEDEPAHYAQGALSIPKGVKEVVIRFRIVPADGEAATFDVPIQVE